MPNQNKQKNKQKNSGGQNKHSGNHQQNKNKGQKQPKVDIYDPTVSLTGDSLKKLVKSEVRNQIRPQVTADKSQISSLNDLLGSQTKQLKGLDNQASSNITQYYKDLAEEQAKSVYTSAALGDRLSGQTAAASDQGQQAIQGAQDASLSSLDAGDQLRGGQPSSARDELLKIIAEQKGYAAQEGQAAQNYGNQQSNTFTNTLLGMGQAQQMQGAATLSDTHRGIQNSITDLQNQYAPDIRSAEADLKQVRASKGDLKNQILEQLRGTERDYNLSKAAVGVNKMTAAAQAQNYKAQAAATKKAAKASKSGNPTLDVAKQYGINKKREQVRGLKSQLAVVSAQSDAASQRQAESLRSQLKVANRQLQAALAKQKASTNSQLKVADAQGAGGGKLSEYTRDQKQRAMSHVRTATSDPTTIAQNKQKTIDLLESKYGINPVLGRWAVNKYLKNSAKRTAAAINPF